MSRKTRVTVSLEPIYWRGIPAAVWVIAGEIGAIALILVVVAIVEAFR